MIHRKTAFLASLSLGAILSSGSLRGGQDPGKFRFVDRGREAGLIHKTLCGGPDKQHLMASGGSGVALFDYDGDGLLDIFIVNSWSYGKEGVTEKPRHRLHRNKGNLAFEDVTDEAGIRVDDFGCGIACADCDDDGDLDIYIANWGPNRLLRNNGDGTFADVSRESGADDPGWSTGAAFFDADGDGDLDLYVANYLDVTPESVYSAVGKTRWRNAITVMDGPFGMPGDADRYYENIGNGRFREATKQAGLEDSGKYYGYTVVATDIDDDGDQDLYVANDSNPNFLYLNDGKGRFKDAGLLSGSALSADGAAQASMGADVGDYDMDGLLDIAVTNFAKDNSTIYRNIGSALFADVSNEVGIAGPTFDTLNWAIILADLDLDMDPDLFIASGHIYPQVDGAPQLKESWRQRNFILENRDAKFFDVTDSCGPGLQIIESSRGAAPGDIDNDGDLDILVSNMDALPNLLVNESPRKGRYLLVKLSDPGPRNRFAIGAKLRLTVGGKVLVREIRCGAYYISQGDLRAHFGLGSAAKAEKLEIRWPDGKTTVLKDIPADQELKVERKR